MESRDDVPPDETGRFAVSFDPAGSRTRAVLIRTFHPDTLGIVLRIMFGMTAYVVAAWVIAASIWLSFDLDDRQFGAIASVCLVLLLTVAWWQQWSQGMAVQQTRYGRLTLGLHPEGVRLWCPTYEVRCRWDAVDRILVRRNHLVLTYLGSRGIAVPVEAFGSDAALRAFAKAASDLKGGIVPQR